MKTLVFFNFGDLWLFPSFRQHYQISLTYSLETLYDNSLWLAGCLNTRRWLAVAFKSLISHKLNRANERERAELFSTI